MNSRSSGEAPAPTISHTEPPEPYARQLVRGILLALVVWIVWSVTYSFYPSPYRITVLLGEPSPRDIKAPRKVTYISDHRTEEARRQAAALVLDVYTGVDVPVVLQQLQLMRDATRDVNSVRRNDSMGREGKLGLLTEIPSLDLQAEMWDRILALDEDTWQVISGEVLRVLDLTMRQEIRDSGLAESRRRVQQITTYALPEDQRAIAVSMARSLVVPNSFHDPDATQTNREAARSAIQPVEWTIREGESILREGELVEEHALEKLEVLGMLEREMDWQHVVGATLLMLLLVSVTILYVHVFEPLLIARPRRETLFALILLTIGVSARMVVPGRTLLPYLFPTAAAVMLAAILLEIRLAMLVAVISAVMVSFNAGGSIELTLYALLGGLVAGLTVWRMDQLGTFVRVTAYVAIANVAIVLGFRLYSHMYDAVGLLQLMVAGVSNAILSSSLAFVAFAVIGRAFGIATSLQLLELARPTHPLFRQLLINAPGSYHHSILVSNMAERAAEVTGADALLARVGSYYHDVGKLSRPYFFAENQTDGENPHKQLDPQTSADIIIGHVTDGVDLARRYRLPDRVTSFIPEHHGTTLVTYFYRQATQSSEGEEAREEDYRYPGPKPQSKETAIVMLADGAEATVRASRPANRAEMERIIRQIINDRLISGQLDECDLTLKDLDGIRVAFISVLQGVFHPRIQYPEKTTRRNGRAAREPSS